MRARIPPRGRPVLRAGMALVSVTTLLPVCVAFSSDTMSASAFILGTDSIVTSCMSHRISSSSFISDTFFTAVSMSDRSFATAFMSDTILLSAFLSDRKGW